jgi:DNA-binding transcriptional MocR family regulator
MQIRLSSYGEASTRPSLVTRLLASFAHDFRDGVDINLGVGYVNEKTIPVPELISALQAVGSQPGKYRQAFNYGTPAGSANLIASIRRAVAELRAGQLPPHQAKSGLSGGPGLDEATLARKRLAIGACGATSILKGLSEALPQGIVVAADPMYYIYRDVLERKGFKILAVPEDGEGIELAALERKLRALGSEAERISFFYVVTVNNPSATVLSNARRRALYEVAAALSRRQKRLIPIIYDLAYELLLHDPQAEPFDSALPYDDLGIVYEIGTLSKILAPGLRIGYFVGPDGPFMNVMIEQTSDTGFSAPLFVQEMASYLLDARIREQQRAVNAGYREKAVAIKQGIERTIGPYLEEQRGGSAGFYYYLTFRDIETHTESPLFKFLTRTTGDAAVDGPKGNPLPRVIYIPGEYCVDPRGDLAERGKRQFRLSYGFEDAPAILRALELMREGVEYVKHGTALAGSAR